MVRVAAIRRAGRFNGVEKSTLPKDRSSTVLNLQYQISIFLLKLGVSYAKKNSKNEKNWPKKYIFGPVRGGDGVEKSKPWKSTSNTFTKSIHQISTS